MFWLGLQHFWRAINMSQEYKHLQEQITTLQQTVLAMQKVIDGYEARFAKLEKPKKTNKPIVEQVEIVPIKNATKKFKKIVQPQEKEESDAVLPIDLLAHVLTCLPTPFYCTFSQVCKAFTKALELCNPYRLRAFLLGKKPLLPGVEYLQSYLPMNYQKYRPITIPASMIRLLEEQLTEQTDVSALLYLMQFVKWRVGDFLSSKFESIRKFAAQAVEVCSKVTSRQFDDNVPYQQFAFATMSDSPLGELCSKMVTQKSLDLPLAIHHAAILANASLTKSMPPEMLTKELACHLVSKLFN